jgi:hypothetical protein
MSAEEARTWFVPGTSQGIFAPEESRCGLEHQGQAMVLSQAPTPWNPRTRKESDRQWGVTLQPYIPVHQLSASVCVWAVDGAGNRAQEPVLFPVRAASRHEILEATDVMVDWSLKQA